MEQDPPELDKAAQQTGATQQLILERMKMILNAMNNSQTDQAMLNKLLEVKNAEEAIQEMNQKKLEAKNIFDDADPDDIFDDK